MNMFAHIYTHSQVYLHVRVSVSVHARDICTFHKCTDTRPIYLNTERVRKREKERVREWERGWRTCVRVPLYVCEERLDAGAGSHGDDSFGLAAASTWIPYVDPRSRPPALTYYPPPSITPLARSSLSYSLVRDPPPSSSIVSPLSFFSCPFHPRASLFVVFPSFLLRFAFSHGFFPRCFHVPTWKFNGKERESFPLASLTSRSWVFFPPQSLYWIWCLVVIV